MALSRKLRDAHHGDTLTYSRKVFIPLTQLCRDVCHYCTFSRPPKADRRAYLTPDEVLSIARGGDRAHCKEALFTLGDRPEHRWDIARQALAELGHATTVDYLHASAALVLEQTGLLPHLNAGVLTIDEMRRLREVSVSMGLMLESGSPRLMQPGLPHHGSPDKDPAVRLAMIDQAGALRIPFTSGILIGIGETREERIDSLLSLNELHQRHGHLQEVIVQNFRAKPGTPMANAPEPDLEELLWTLSVARIVFGPRMNIQAPPNLTPHEYQRLIDAGINDWGGISPVTRDHVNPEAAWPQIQVLEQRCAQAGKVLSERLAIYPEWARDAGRWVDEKLAPRVRQATDSRGAPREGQWVSGVSVGVEEDFEFPPAAHVAGRSDDLKVARLLDRCWAGHRLPVEAVETLFNASGAALARVLHSADRLRHEAVGSDVRYVVNRNINYTNVCTHKCGFCAFSKGKGADHLRGKPYNLDELEIRRRVAEAWERGATEVCMQGGIHPDYTGDTYLDIVRMVKAEQGAMHVHAFSPLEVTHGAQSLGMPLRSYLRLLKQAGLGTLPGTAAEILDDGVRALICPGKLSTTQWLDVMRAAHAEGIRSTCTIMFGHLESPVHWARHLLALRDLQQETGGFTEFVPLPFVPNEAPMFLRGQARRGPTAREVVLMHAVARLVLHPLIQNIQVSWVKLGTTGVRACLAAGANDLGGTLMNESISRAAGACHGQELGPAQMDALIRDSGRDPRQRTTLYGPAPIDQRARSYEAPELTPLVQTPVIFEKTRRDRAARMQETSE
ncbi:MAG: 5-amino-6-(D-ribitylamino)uracil--L-tyrosine 4-hydroxyphenyl transferase CofH [Hydrogenophaga sp.]|nr:5-amino-6-(D-ribitylamino)uracil--L-tyrosine 4-hydroxyphenyl transferase CofH [Hydrogenophaga sp.]